MDKEIKAVLFDFDGTLTRPGSLDFGAIRTAIGAPAGLPILEHIATLAPGVKRNRAIRILEKFELAAAKKSRPNPGAETLVAFLKKRGLKLGILTRNSLISVRTALRNFRRVQASDFDAIVTRHDPARPKPSPDGVRLAARKMGIKPAALLVVGDYIFDIQAGRRAGARTAFLVSPATRHFPDPPADVTIRALKELRLLFR
jgi:HAD superfamily hydrolase (TIGR01509 family)